MGMEDEFFLGKKVDLATGKATEEIVTYDPADMTTHGVVTGMTGSGKTGLCIGLLEEAALKNIPAIIVDPKGDLTNLLLHFPDLRPTDFEPWMDADAARKSGKSVTEMAAETAASWKKGLDSWGITRERIAALDEKVKFTIYTPGSDSGVPVSIIASLKAPDISWDGNREVIMERISSTVSALLGLIGLTDLDPIRSREHILLSNIFQNAWSQGHDLDLSELILQTQSPPFEKLGVFPVEQFYPAKDRMQLAMTLNNFLASPPFQIWMTGEPLDIQSMLYTREGKPRHSIFYVAHLSDTERMFFITLLYSAIETWMRSQTGTSGLRALVYFDEIVGYLPPLGNPPSKMVILRMLKQARAFGVGLLLATQNPVDVDYKALSNAGTWFIGKLQTDQDKQRLLDGLESVAGGVNRSDYDKLISSLGKRVFLLHNVHNSAPITMTTRWAMNYLAGPLTRVQIPLLNKLAGAQQAAPEKNAASAVAPAASAPQAAKPAVATASSGGSSRTKPQVPGGIKEVFLPAAGGAASYTPLVIGQVQIRYLDRRYGVDQLVRRTVLLADPDPRGIIHWEDYVVDAMEPRNWDTTPVSGIGFGSLEGTMTDPKLIARLQSDFEDWVYKTGELRIRANTILKKFAAPEVSEADFIRECLTEAQKQRDLDVEKSGAALRRKKESLQQKLTREEAELTSDQTELNARTAEEVGAGLQTVLGLLGGRKRSVNTNLTKRRMTANAKADVDESIQTIALLKKQIADVDLEISQANVEITKKWEEIASQITELPLLPTKTNIFLEIFGIAWKPE